MAKSEGQPGLPAADSLDDLVEFFETHDMGEYWDTLPEVEFDIQIRRRTHWVALDHDLVGKIADLAKAREQSSETLINALLREKIAEAS